LYSYIELEEFYAYPGSLGGLGGESELRREAKGGTESVGEDTTDAASEGAGADNARDEARETINGALDLATDLASLEVELGGGGRLGHGSRCSDSSGNEAESND
jgi:hypothetical protein